jgi:hypothetical protein
MVKTLELNIQYPSKNIKAGSQVGQFRRNWLKRQKLEAKNWNITCLYRNLYFNRDIQDIQDKKKLLP